MSGSNLLFVFTGSIAGFKACEAVSRLVQRGHSVRVVATEAALRFVGAATLEGLTGRPVLSDLFASGSALEHISLTRWADLTIVCPATANALNRLAAGLADDLPGALFLARDQAKPFLAAPAMNPAMWSHPATRAAVERLTGWGVRFLPVGSGRTACGEVGEGRLAEPEVIVASVERALAHPRRRLRVLLTGGGTSEPVDGVRVLTNRSSGRTAALLAEHLERCGHDVVYLRARNAARPVPPCTEETFETFSDLEAALKRRLGSERYDAVIHAAAVGDFRVEHLSPDGGVQTVLRGKIDSQTPPLLRLCSQPKLVDQLRGFSASPLQVVAFKLTTGATLAAAEAEVAELQRRSGADLVVHNDLATGPSDNLPAAIHQPSAGAVYHCAGRQELAETLEALLVNPTAAA